MIANSRARVNSHRLLPGRSYPMDTSCERSATCGEAPRWFQECHFKDVMKHFPWQVALALLTCAPLRAQSQPIRLSLVQAIQRAVAENPEVQIANLLSRPNPPCRTQPSSFHTPRSAAP